MKRSSGYTLVEVMVTVVIVGVLAGLALPSYFGTVEETRSNEAKINLQIIRAGQKVYALNDTNKFYWDPESNFTLNGPKGNGINKTLNVDISTQYYDIVEINADNSADPKTFFAKARRNTVQGGDGQKTITINQDGAFS